MSEYNFYETWKQNPSESVVIDSNVIRQMIASPKAASLSIAALNEAFSNKHIIHNFKQDPITNEQNEQNAQILGENFVPTLTVLSGIPGAGKTTYAKKLAQTYNHTIVLTNDSLRAALSGLNEEDINEKIRNTTITTQEGEKNLETFVGPLINTAKHAIIKTLLSHGYNIIVDGVHPKGFMRDDFKRQYGEYAKIIHTLIAPAKLTTGIIKAGSRKERPENKETILKTGKRIEELLQQKDENKNFKYHFDHVIFNHYEDGGFQEATLDDSFHLKQKEILHEIYFTGYFLQETAKQQLQKKLHETMLCTKSFKTGELLSLERKKRIDHHSISETLNYKEFLDHYTIQYQPKKLTQDQLGEKKLLKIVGVAHNNFGWALILDDNSCEVNHNYIQNDNTITQIFPHITRVIGNEIKIGASYSKSLIAGEHQQSTITYFENPIYVESIFGYMSKTKNIAFSKQQVLNWF